MDDDILTDDEQLELVSEKINKQITNMVLNFKLNQINNKIKFI